MGCGASSQDKEAGRQHDDNTGPEDAAGHTKGSADNDNANDLLVRDCSSGEITGVLIATTSSSDDNKAAGGGPDNPSPTGGGGGGARGRLSPGRRVPEMHSPVQAFCAEDEEASALPAAACDPASFGPGFTAFLNGAYMGQRNAAALPHGYGTLHEPGGGSYTGEFAAGVLEGWGCYTYRNGDSYEGQFQRGHSEGLGRYTFRRYGVYSGEFKRGQVHGTGVLRVTAPGGGVYSGRWASGLRQGRGHSETEGSHYEGEWAGGREEGRGVCTDRRVSYFGGWRGGEKHGRGVVVHHEDGGEGGGGSGGDEPAATTKTYLAQYSGAGARRRLAPIDGEEAVRLLAQDPEWAAVKAAADEALSGIAERVFPAADIAKEVAACEEALQRHTAEAAARVPKDWQAPPPLPAGGGESADVEAIRRQYDDLVKQCEGLREENARLSRSQHHQAKRSSVVMAATRWQATASRLRNSRIQKSIEEAKVEKEHAQTRILDLELRLSVLTSDQNTFMTDGTPGLEMTGASPGVQKALELRQQLEIAEAHASTFDDDEGVEELNTTKRTMENEVGLLQQQIMNEKSAISNMQTDMTQMAKEHEAELQRERQAMQSEIRKSEEHAAVVRKQLEEARVAESKRLGECESKFEEQRAQLEAEMEEIERQKRQVQESFLHEKGEARRLRNELEDIKGQIRVYVRSRPLNKVEMAEAGSVSCVTFKDEMTVAVLPPSSKYEEKTFDFNVAFNETDSQEAVFEDTKNLISSAVDGYNVCVFAYGQTGSGKTYTLTGEDGQPGIAPRACAEIFEVCKSCTRGPATVSCYMVEVYNEELCDLLYQDDGSGKRPPLLIKKDKKGLVHVQNAVEEEAATHSDLYDLFRRGLSGRKTRATRMNEGSSRSHLIFSVKISVENTIDKSTTLGKFTICDLAGSERMSKTHVTDKVGIAEAKAINQSLTILGNVVSALSKKEKHVPYRESKLTQIMSDSLGGNAKTLMFVNVSPSFYNYEETISSLNYATRVKMVVNNALKTVETDEIKRLRAKIKELQAAKGLSTADEDLEDIE